MINDINIIKILHNQTILFEF